MIGQTVSHYRILEKLGGGGMGVVYKAEDTKLKRTVALKFLPPELTSDPEAKARFIHEAQAASSLQHNNICNVHDVDESLDGQMFIVMDLYEGETLKSRISSGKLKIEEATDIAIQIAQGLLEAHQHGIIHRDVKPANIIITKSGVAKIVDFGLAKLSGSSKLTKTGSTLGTVAYMAPEQLQGSDVDARADIFSLGIVLYEMLTGQTPFRGDHEAALMYSIMNEEPAPLQMHIPDVSSELIHVVNRALEKDPASRYKTMDDMLIDLRRIRRDTSKVFSTDVYSTRSHGFLKRRGTVIGATILGLMAIAALVAVVVLKNRPPRLNENRTERILDIPYRSVGKYPGFSRDGKWVVFGANDTDSTLGVFLLNIAKGQPRRLTTNSYLRVYSTEISPDDGEVVFNAFATDLKSMDLYVVPTSAGQERKIAAGWIAVPRWRADGRLIGYVRGRPGDSQWEELEFCTINPDGTGDRSLFRDTVRPTWNRNFSFDWSPDGQSIAWIRGGIIVRHLESKRERLLTTMKFRIDEVSWAENGLIAFSSNKAGNTNIWTITEGGEDLQQITRGFGSDFVPRFSVEANRLMYNKMQSTSHLWIAGIDGRDVHQLTFDDRMVSAPAFSPDGKRIVFAGRSADMFAGDVHIYEIQTDGSGWAQMTSGNTVDSGPVWSPDGTMIAYVSRSASEPYDSSRIYWIDAAFPSTRHLVGKGVAANWISGRQLLIQYLANSGTLQLCTATLENGSVFISTADSTTAFPLPDGVNTLVRDRRKASNGWWLRKLRAAQETSGKLLVAADDIQGASLVTSLKYLLYLRKDGELWRVSIPSGRRENLPKIFRGLSPGGSIQLSPDGSKAIYVRGEPKSRLVLIENVFE